MEQEEIDAAFRSMHLLLGTKEELVDSMTAKINRIKGLYGPIDWEARITILERSLGSWQGKVGHYRSTIG